MRLRTWCFESALNVRNISLKQRWGVNAAFNQFENLHCMIIPVNFESGMSSFELLLDQEDWKLHVVTNFARIQFTQITHLNISTS